MSFYDYCAKLNDGSVKKLTADEFKKAIVAKAPKK